MRLTTQLAVAVVTVVVSSNLVSLGVVGVSLWNDAGHGLQDRVRAAVAGVSAVSGWQRSELEGSAAALGNAPVIRAALGGDVDDETLEGIADQQRLALGVDTLVLRNAEGKVRAVSPRTLDRSDWSFSAPPPVAVVGGNAFILAALPIEVRNQTLGELIVGRQLGAPMVERLAKDQGVEAVLVVNGEVKASKVQGVDALALARALGAGRQDVREVEVAGEGFVSGAAELAPGATVVVARARSAEFERFAATLARLIAVGLVSVLATLGALRLLLGQILRRMNGLLGGLVKTVNELRDSSSSIQAACSDQSASSAQQAAAVIETRQTMESLLETATRISEAARMVSLNATEASRATTGIGVAVKTLVSESQKITEISETIRSVAEKSDLLALNASLEGTRAGAAGEGFSLVASEMRRLAENVAAAAREIQKITGSIRRPLDESVTASTESKRLADATADSALQISEVTRQQRAATEQVNQTMDEVKSLLSHNAHTTQATNQAATALAALADRLSQLTTDFSREVAAGD